MFDLMPATDALARVVDGVHDDQLDLPTPCRDSTVGDLLDHVDGLSLAFADAAAKTRLDGGSPGPSADASRLGSDWRRRIPARLSGLAEAWRAEAAWSGMTEAGGVALPGEVAAAVALNEVIVHGWDIAAATGQAYAVDAELIGPAAGFVGSAVAEHPNGSPGLFGPPVAVPDGARPLDRLVALTGRDPGWPSSPPD